MNSPYDSNRREFFQKLLPLGCIACLNPSAVCRAMAAQDGMKDADTFKADSQMTYEQVYDFVFKQNLIPHFTAIGRSIGEEKLIAILKDSISKRSFQAAAQWASGIKTPDLKSYTEWMRKPDRFFQHVVAYSIVEDTPETVELKVTKCLWAKTFTDAKQGDLGYAAVCFGDYAHAAGFSKHLSMVRTKTLMQGDDSCNHRYIWKA